MRLIGIFCLCALFFLKCFWCAKIDSSIKRPLFEFVVKKAWISTRYPCEKTYSDREFDIIVMLPLYRQTYEVKKFLGGKQINVFRRTIQNFRKVNIKYYLFQASAESIACQSFGYEPNKHFPGSEKTYKYNYDWLFNTIQDCALYYLKPQKNVDQLKRIMIIVHEGKPVYDVEYREVLLWSKEPWMSKGKYIPDVFNKQNISPIFIVRPQYIHDWLGFAHRLQLGGRAVLDMTTDIVNTLPKEINRIICTQMDFKTNTDFFQYYVDNTIGSLSNHDFKKYPLYFVFVFPTLFHKTLRTLATDLEVYNILSLYLSTLQTRYPESEIAFLQYEYGVEPYTQHTCSAYITFKRYTDVYTNNPTKYWWDLLLTDKSSNGAKYKALNDCWSTLFNIGTADTKIKELFPFIITFDHTDMFLSNALKKVASVKTSFYAQLLSKLLVKNSHMHHFVTQKNKIIYTSKPSNVYNVLNENYKQTFYHITNDDHMSSILSNIIEKADEHLKHIDRIIAAEKYFVLKTKIKKPKIITDINILIQIPQKLGPETFPLLIYFSDNNYKMFSQQLRQSFPHVNLQVAYQIFDDDPSQNSANICSFEHEFSTTLKKPHDFFMKYVAETFDRVRLNISLEKMVQCPVKYLKWPKTSEQSTINLMVSLFDALPHFQTTKLEKTEEPMESILWREFFKVYEENIHVVTLIPKRMESSYHQLIRIPTYTYSYEKFIPLNVYLMQIIGEIIENQLVERRRSRSLIF